MSIKSPHAKPEKSAGHKTKTAKNLTDKSPRANSRERHTAIDAARNVHDHSPGAAHFTRGTTERRRADKALRESENRYRMLFKKMLEGCALHEIICNKRGIPTDYRYLDANPAFEKITGFKVVDIVGKTALEIAPDIDPFFIKTYGKVALTGKTGSPLNSIIKAPAGTLSFLLISREKNNSPAFFRMQQSKNKPRKHCGKAKRNSE